MYNYQMRLVLSAIQYSVIGYFLYQYLIKPLMDLIEQIYCAFKIHSLPGHPILGHLPKIVSDYTNLSNSLQGTCESIYEILLETGKAANLSIFWVGWIPIFAVTGPETELILNKVNLKKPPIYKLIGLKDGLVVSERDKWRGRRKMIEPYFKSKRLPLYAVNMDKEVTHLPELISKNVGKSLDITQDLHFSAINVAFQILWGVASDQFLILKEEMIEALDWASKLTISRFLNPFYWNDSTYKFFEIGRTHLKNNDKISSLTDRVYDACVPDDNSNRKQSPSSYDNNLDKQGLTMFNFLKSNADAGKIDGEGIKEEIVTMLAAANQTTAVAIHWALFCLGHNSQCEERLYQEIISFFPEGKPVDDFEEIKKCTFLDQCVKESLRLYPPIPQVLRELEEDVYIEGKRIPKGSRVTVNILGTHRDPRVYENPDQYDPDRWSPENASKIPKGSYLPFALGPRNCIGYRFALMEMKIYIINVVRRFKMKSTQKPESIKQLAAISLKPTCAIEITFTERN